MFSLMRRPQDNLKKIDWLRRELDDFDNIFSNLAHFHGCPTISGLNKPAFSPSLEIAEKKDRYVATMELPGLEENDVEITLDEDNTLIVTGEKKQQKKEEGDDYFVSEISYGSFRREIPIGQGIEKDKIEASFSKGVLNIVLPKTVQKEKAVKKIDVKKSP